MKIKQLELDIKVQHKCLKCGRKISHYGLGKECERKIIEQFRKQFSEKYYSVILKYLTKQGDNQDV